MDYYYSIQTWRRALLPPLMLAMELRLPPPAFLGPSLGVLFESMLDNGLLLQYTNLETGTFTAIAFGNGIVVASSRLPGPSRLAVALLETTAVSVNVVVAVTAFPTSLAAWSSLK